MSTVRPNGNEALRNLFLQEMRALRQEGKTFAQEFPEAAGLLDPSRVDDRDPGVERLTEAFGFLAARVRQAAAMEEDGLAGHLLELFEDGLDRILPSVVVFQAVSRRKLPGTAFLTQGQEFKTAGSGTKGFRFALGHDLQIDPLQISHCHIDLDDHGTSSLEMEFHWTGSTPAKWPDSIPMFLYGDAPVVWSLRYGLCRRIARIEVWTGNAWIGAPEVVFQALNLPGYDGDPHAHPLSDARDFFCCDERFRFVELRGLFTLPVSIDGKLRLRVCFDGAFPRAMVRGVKAEVFRLHAGVAVNRFEDSCDGLVWDHTRSEMPLRMARGTSQELLEALRVESLTKRNPARRTRYQPFSRHRNRERIQSEFFLIHRRSDTLGRPLTLLSLGWPDLATELEVEYVAVHGTFCDGNRPYEETTGRGFSPSNRDFPAGLEFQTLTRPTPAHRPAARVELHTRLMTLVDSHFHGTLDAQRMRDTLRLFMWDPTEAKRTLIEAIQEISVETGHRIQAGVPRPSQKVRIRLRDTTCTPDTWERLGILDAFAEILGKLVEEETPLGMLSSTTVVVEPAGVELEIKK